jgi:hypothetical protein
MRHYLTELAREWVPYDTARGRIALSPEQQQAHILKLYRQAGLPVDSPTQQTAPQNKSQNSVADTGKRRREQNLAWVRKQCAGKPLQSILQHYHLQRLEEISNNDLASLMQRIRQHQQKHAS